VGRPATDPVVDGASSWCAVLADMPAANAPPGSPIAAIVPRGLGHQFVIYGDSCSGVPGAPHEETFAQVNRIVARLTPSPQFIVFPGDEIAGLTGVADTLRAQWRYWTDVEMKWLRGRDIPLYRTTSNHTVYDGISEAVFREIQYHAPDNGPRDQRGLSYAVRRGDLLTAPALRSARSRAPSARSSLAPTG